jgi:hypothetical protein
MAGRGATTAAPTRRMTLDGPGVPDFRGGATHRQVRTCHDAFWLGNVVTNKATAATQFGLQTKKAPDVPGLQVGSRKECPEGL